MDYGIIPHPVINRYLCRSQITPIFTDCGSVCVLPASILVSIRYNDRHGAEEETTGRHTRMDGYIRGHDVLATLLFYHAFCNEHDHTEEVSSPRRYAQAGLYRLRCFESV